MQKYQLTPSQYQEYQKNSVQGQDKIADWLGLPKNRYFAVSRFPVKGIVRILGYREIKKDKISKSDQK